MSLLDCPNFSDYIEADYSLPHKLLFNDDPITAEEKTKYNYLFAVLYFITNSKFLIANFLNFNPAEEEQPEKIFKDMINNLLIYIKMMEEKKDEDQIKRKLSESIKSIREFHKCLKEDNKVRDLINEIICRTIKVKKGTKKSDISSQSNENLSSGEIESTNSIINYLNSVPTSTSYGSLEASREESYIWSSKYEGMEDDDKNNIIIIKTTESNGKVYYRYSNLIIFNIDEENKQYKLENCLINYLNEIKTRHRKIDVKDIVYYKVPDSIIIVLFFGKINENFEKCKYDFAEILDFSKEEFSKYMDPSLKNKKYMLSSLIACKFPGRHNELFYTFCRNENSKFNMYYNKEGKVSEQNDIDNKLKKTEIVKSGSNTSYPYALIYDEIKEKQNY